MSWGAGGRLSKQKIIGGELQDLVFGYYATQNGEFFSATAFAEFYPDGLAWYPAFFETGYNATTLSNFGGGAYQTIELVSGPNWMGVMSFNLIDSTNVTGILAELQDPAWEYLAYGVSYQWYTAEDGYGMIAANHVMITELNPFDLDFELESISDPADANPQLVHYMVAPIYARTRERSNAFILLAVYGAGPLSETEPFVGKVNVLYRGNVVGCTVVAMLSHEGW